MTYSPKFINSYKTPLSNEEFQHLKFEILRNPKNADALNELDQKLDNVINPQVNTSKYYAEVRNSLREEIIDKATGFSHAVNYSAHIFMQYKVTQMINDMLEYPHKYNMNEDDIIFVYKNKERIIELLTKRMMEANLTEYTDDIFREVLHTINDSIYATSKSNEIEVRVVPHITRIVNAFPAYIQDGLDDLRNLEIMPSTTISIINEIFQHRASIIKTNLYDNYIKVIRNGTDTIINKVNDIVDNIFCAPREFISDIQNIIPSLGLTLNDIARGIDFDGMRGLPGILDGLSQLTNNSLPLMSSNIHSGNISNLKSQLQKQTTKQCQQIQNNKVGSGSTNNPNNNTTPGTTNVKDRGGNSSSEGSSSDGSGNNNDAKKPTSDEPQEQEYDNEKPDRAEVKNDPRRDNTQELLLWETDKEKYVLLRDGIGNYLMLDEDKKCVRIQHVSGSYIQFASNGDIQIESAKHVRINCSGAKYIKQF